MFQEDYFAPQVQEVPHPNNINYSGIKISNNKLDEIVQVWKEVCECNESQIFKEKIFYFFETIELLKNDMNNVKLQNKKLMKENLDIKNELKELRKKLEKLQLERRKKQRQIVAGTDGACEDTRLQGSSVPTADHAWLFSTEQVRSNTTFYTHINKYYKKKMSFSADSVVVIIGVVKLRS